MSYFFPTAGHKGQLITQRIRQEASQSHMLIQATVPASPTDIPLPGVNNKTLLYEAEEYENGGRAKTSEMAYPGVAPHPGVAPDQS